MIKIGNTYFNPNLIFAVEQQPYNPYVTDPLAVIVSASGYTVAVSETVKNVIEKLTHVNERER